jgi:hypothetical protein
VTARQLGAVIAVALLGMLALPGSAGAAPPPPPPDPTCSPAPADCSAWHTAAVVTVNWAQAPPGVSTDGCATETITQDTGGKPVSCTWFNNDGSKSNTVFARRDATPPNVTVRADRAPDSNGWFNHSFSVEFFAGDALSGVSGCSPVQAYGGPDTGAASVSGGCSDNAGNVRAASFDFKYDATPPSVVAKPDRDPNPKGWYNRMVRVQFVGSDATSGVGSCAPDIAYGGPDARSTAVAGTCTDNAANTSSSAAYELRYDEKAPELGRVQAEPRSDEIVLQWAASKDASHFRLVRKPGLKGARLSTIYTGAGHRFVDDRVRKGVKYGYTLTAADEAGNETAKGLRARTDALSGARKTSGSVATPALTRPVEGARLAAPPLLDWTAVRGASYYNVQVFRNGKKILTAWPSSTSFHLARSWRFDGRAQRLAPGRYRWYVWPGFGARAASNYGKLLGTRTFVVTG